MICPLVEAVNKNFLLTEKNPAEVLPEPDQAEVLPEIIFAAGITCCAA